VTTIAVLIGCKCKLVGGRETVESTLPAYRGRFAAIVYPCSDSANNFPRDVGWSN